MKYSKLAHEIEIMELNHKHELKILEMKQKNEINELLSSCKHQYEDGSIAKNFMGNQWDHYNVCAICGKKL